MMQFLKKILELFCGSGNIYFLCIKKTIKKTKIW